MVKYELLINVDILKTEKYTVYINCLNVIFFFVFYNSMLSAIIQNNTENKTIQNCLQRSLFYLNINTLSTRVAI